MDQKSYHFVEYAFTSPFPLQRTPHTLAYDPKVSKCASTSSITRSLCHVALTLSSHCSVSCQRGKKDVALIESAGCLQKRASRLCMARFFQTQCSLDHNVSCWQVSTWLWNAGEGGVWAWILSECVQLACPTVTKSASSHVFTEVKVWSFWQTAQTCLKNCRVKMPPRAGQYTTLLRCKNRFLN